MAKHTAHYVCQSCGASHPKWSGRCDACGAWNSILEEAVGESVPGGLGKSGTKRGARVNIVGLEGDEPPFPRLKTGIEEFDRVVGSGMVTGSAILVGGDPGIGKSTLLLQVAAAVAGGARAVYISGEEAVDQVRLRATRLGLSGAKVGLATATNLRDILASLDVADGPNL
ncbi:MAG: ATPase domain-containing protein, partial [Alphaproteobacteria bacterium]